MFEFLRVDSIFSSSFLILCSHFGDDKFIILILKGFDLLLFGLDDFLVFLEFILNFVGWVEVIFGSFGHDLINRVEFRFGSELSNLLMKLLYLETVLLSHLVELFFEILNHSLLLPQLFVLVVNYPLQSFYRLLGRLSYSCVFFFIIGFDLFLTVKEPSGIGLELTGGKLSLHDKWIGRDIHLTAKVHKFIKISLRNHIFDWGLQMVDFLLLFHQLLFQFSNLIQQLLSVLIIIIVGSHLFFVITLGFNKLRDVIHMVEIEVLVLFVDCLLLLFLLVEVVHCCYLLLFDPIGLSLELLHEFYLVR